MDFYYKIFKIEFGKHVELRHQHHSIPECLLSNISAKLIHRIVNLIARLNLYGNFICNFKAIGLSNILNSINQLTSNTFA